MEFANFAPTSRYTSKGTSMMREEISSIENDNRLPVHGTHGYRIGGVMASGLPSSTVERGFESRSDQTKDYEIGICCFSAKHATLI